MKQNTRLFVILSAMVLFPYLLYGFQYFPVLDDYIQYWGYPAYGDLGHVYTTIGTIVTRPFAALLDPLFWGRLWPCLSIALLLMTALHIFSLKFIYNTCHLYQIKISPLFGLLCLMLPLGMEGRFWLSAATRLVVGLFFAALSLYFLANYLERTKKYRFLILFACFQIIACGFYEAVAVFAAAATVLLCILSYKNHGRKTIFLIPFISVCNVGLLFVYYKLMAGFSSLGGRALAVSTLSVFEKAKILLTQLGEIFSLSYERLIIGSLRGIKLLFGSGVWGVILFALALFLSFVFCLIKNKKIRYTPARVLLTELFGLLLFLAPLLPNLLVAEVWLTNRSLFLSVIGLAFMVEPLFSLGNAPLRRGLLFVMAFLCMTATINEYDTYKRVHQQDILLLDAVISEMTPEAKNGQQSVIVVLSEEVKTEQNAFYKDHVKSVFDSDWALTGAIRSRLGSLAPKNIQPIWQEPLPNVDNAQIIYIELQ